MKTLLSLGLAAALAFGASAALAQTSDPKKADKEAQSFIQTAIQHNYAEIDTGKLAQEKGKHAAVKEFGAMMVKDHGDANTKAIALAKQLGVDKPPESADMMHQATYLKLKALSGDTFDRSYVDGMVKDHENDVKEFQKQAGMGHGASSFAKETLPTLEKHLVEIKKLQSQLAAPTTGSGKTQ